MLSSRAPRSHLPNRPAVRLAIAAFALIVIGIAAFQLLSDRLWWLLNPGPEYWSAFESVAGLERDDDVRYGGLSVGRVRRVAIDSSNPGRLIVVFRVKSETPLGPGTRASIFDIIWPASRYLNLRPDTGQVRELPQGSEIKTAPGATLETLAADLAVALDRTDTLLTAVTAVVDRDFASQAVRLVARLDTLTGAVAGATVKTAPRIDDALRHMTRVLARTDTLLTVIDSARPALKAAPVATVAMLEEIREILAQLRAALGTGGDFAALMRDLGTVSTHLARLTAQLDHNPSGVLGGRASLPKPSGPKLRE